MISAGWCFRACQILRSKGVRPTQGCSHWRHHWRSPQGYLRSFAQHPDQAHGSGITGFRSILRCSWRVDLQIALSEIYSLPGYTMFQGLTTSVSEAFFFSSCSWYLVCSETMTEHLVLNKLAVDVEVCHLESLFLVSSCCCCCCIRYYAVDHQF